MERIKNAVDKARSERFAHAGAGTPASAASVSRPPAASSIEHWLAAQAPVHLDPRHLEDNRIVAYGQANALRGVFDLLRTQVLQRMGEKGWKTLAVTSPSAGSGKTVVAVNLAMSIAHHPQHSATLVDFDLRRPNVAACLGLTTGTTLCEVLKGEASLEESVVNVGMPRLAVVPTARPVAAASDVLSSARVHSLIGQLRSSAPTGITIFDLPPVTAVDDVIAVLPRIDCVLLVVGNGSSTKREIEEAQRHLARYPLIGTVFNKASTPARNAGYYERA